MENEFKLEKVAIRMVQEPPLISKEPVDNPIAAVRVLADMLRDYDREVMCVVNLRSDLRPINMNIVSIGILNSSLAHPREILKSSILSNAAAILLIHNHPSGSLVPSNEDISITNRMQEVGSLIGISVVDHIIIGNGEDCYSFRNKDILNLKAPVFSADINKINLRNNELEISADIKAAGYKPTKKLVTCMLQLNTELGGKIPISDLKHLKGAYKNRPAVDKIIEKVDKELNRQLGISAKDIIPSPEQ